MKTLNEILNQRIKDNELSSRDVEELLNVSRLTVANWRDAGHLTALRKTKRYGYIYSLDEVLEVGKERGHYNDGAS